jgi:serine/threonine protein kinase
VKATIAFRASKNHLKISTGDFLQTALFIESKRAKYINEKKYHLSRKETGLKFPLTIDRETGTYFIDLEGDRRTFIGQGKKKVVTKAILYDSILPKVVARGEQLLDKNSEAGFIYELKREMRMTQILRGTSGVFSVLGVDQHRRDDKEVVNIYSKLYHPGQLQAALLDKKVQLSMYEKMRAALDILQGLESLHTRGIVHRDLGARNYLINIPSGPPGHRNVEVVIADLGRAEFITEVGFTKVQGNTTYAAPEALFHDQMKCEKYFATDVFAVGCTLYFLFHEKQAPWQEFRYLKDLKRSVQDRHRELVSRINQSTEQRRLELTAKRGAGIISRRENFELVILRMLHVDPHKRGTAMELRQQLESVVNAP